MGSARRFRGLAIGLMLAAGSAMATGQDSGRVFIQGGRIIPVVGDEIDKGSVLIENGKITAIGKDLTAPFDATVIDATDMVVMPGVVEALTSNGLDVSNENIDVGAFLQVADALDPSQRHFEESLRNGILAIHVSQGFNCVISGLSRVVRPIGMTVQEMTIKGDAGLLIAVAPKGGYDRAAQAAVLRGTFTELDRYLERLAERLYEEELKKKGEEITVGPAEARKRGKDLVSLAKIDDPHRNLTRLRQGRLDAFLWCAKAMDLAPALALAKAQGFLEKSTIVVGSECHKVATALKQAGRPVVLPAGQTVHREIDRMTDEEVETFVPRVLFDKKVAFAISDSLEPWYEAARLVRNGVSRQAAIESVTINAARAIGMEDRLGSLEKGKDANVVILSGDPLGGSTWVETALIDGRMVYERAKDRSLRELIQGVQDAKSAGKKAAEVKPAEPAKAEESKTPTGATGAAPTSAPSKN